MKIVAFAFAWLVAALLVGLPFGYAMRSTPKDRVRSERQEESEVESAESVECVEELAAR